MLIAELKLAQLEMTSKGKQPALGAGCSEYGGVMATTAWAYCWPASHRHQRRGGLANRTLIVGAALRAARWLAALLGKQRINKATPPL